MAVVTRAEPSALATVDTESEDGPTVELGAVPPQEALTRATPAASNIKEAIGLGNWNDIGYSWRKIPTVDFINIPDSPNAKGEP